MPKQPGPNRDGQKPAEIYTTARPVPSGAKSVYHGAGQSAKDFDIGGVDSDELAHVVAMVVLHGDAVSFSLTSDRGAFSTTIMCGNERHKTYANTPDLLLVRWRDILQNLYD